MSTDAPMKKAATKKRSTSKKTGGAKKGSGGSVSGGKYITAIIQAINDLHVRGGASRQAIKKHLEGQKELDPVSSVHIRAALKRGVDTGTLKTDRTEILIGG